MIVATGLVAASLAGCGDIDSDDVRSAFADLPYEFEYFEIAVEDEDAVDWIVGGRATRSDGARTNFLVWRDDTGPGFPPQIIRLRRSLGLNIVGIDGKGLMVATGLKNPPSYGARKRGWSIAFDLEDAVCQAADVVCGP